MRSTTTVLVPVRRSPTAKSRVALEPGPRAALAAAMAEDVLLAVAATGLPHVVVDGGPDLDAAVTAAAHAVAGPVAVLMADLPCVRPEEILALLALAEGLERWVVADAAGTGTAALGAARGPWLRTSYGAGSRARHAAHASDLTAAAGPGLRRDVDTLEDLTAAARLGLGPRTTVVHLSLEGCAHDS